MKKNIYQTIICFFMFSAFTMTSTTSSAQSFLQWQEMEQQVLDMVNLQRAHHQLDWLKANSELHEAARLHSFDMGTNDYFSHTSEDGTTYDQRITAQGYQWNAVGENIAAGYANAYTVMYGTNILEELSAFDISSGYGGFTSWVEVGDNWSNADWEAWNTHRKNQSKPSGWMGSTGHRNNILSINFSDIGIGYAYVASALYRRYWTQDFGAGDTNSEAIPTKPLAPSASDGVYTDHIQITWETTIDVDEYQLFRCADMALDNCVRIYTGNTTAVTDETAENLVNYYYRTRNCNKSGCSEYSLPDEGYRDSSAGSQATPGIIPVLQLLLFTP